MIRGSRGCRFESDRLHVLRTHLESVCTHLARFGEPTVDGYQVRPQGPWFEATRDARVPPPLAQQQSARQITGRSGCDSSRADCDRGRSSRGTWMWTTAKRVRVPSITPCMHTEALTVEITEAACKAVALADNWVRVPAPPRTSSSHCFAERVRVLSQVSYARPRRCDSGLRYAAVDQQQSQWSERPSSGGANPPGGTSAFDVLPP